MRGLSSHDPYQSMEVISNVSINEQIVERCKLAIILLCINGFYTYV